MAETIGEALDQGWALMAHCAAGRAQGAIGTVRCTWKHDLDMVTLVATRGRDFPLARVAERLRCPCCGSRRIAVAFLPMNSPQPPQRSRAARDAFKIVRDQGR